MKFDSSRHQIGPDGKVYRRCRKYWLFGSDGKPERGFKNYEEVHRIRLAIGEEAFKKLNLHYVWSLEEVQVGEAN